MASQSQRSHRKKEGHGMAKKFNPVKAKADELLASKSEEKVFTYDEQDRPRALMGFCWGIKPIYHTL